MFHQRAAMRILIAALAFNCFLASTRAIILDVCSPARDAAALAAHGAQAIYNGNTTAGTLGLWPFPPYYWWQSGGSWGSMLQYWLYTGDASYNGILHEAIMSQLGPKNDFINAAHVFDTGNDDQGFWALIAMSAAEHDFQPPSPTLSWLTVADNVWSEYRNRWNTTYCGGGLKWQFTPSNSGFNYKQTISNGVFFQLSACLARFTGNETYVTWATKIWNWSRATGLIDDLYNVYDGSDELIDCRGVDHHQWSYNTGVFLFGAANLVNLTGSMLWVNRTLGLLDSTATFFTPFANASSSFVAFEPACETIGTCNTDEQSMKAYLIRWMTMTSLLMPVTAPRINQYMRASAVGAAQACTGGPYGNSCGSKWYTNQYDGMGGLGQQINAMEVFGALLVDKHMMPKTMPGVKLAQNVVGGKWPVVDAAPTGPAKPLHDPVVINSST